MQYKYVCTRVWSSFSLSVLGLTPKKTLITTKIEAN